MADKDQLTTRKYLNSPTDWQNYKFEVQAYSFKLNASEILEGTEKCPVEPTSSTPAEKAAYKKELTDYKERNGSLYFYIVQGVGPNYLSTIQDTKIAAGDCKGIWEALTAVFEGTSELSLTNSIDKLIHFPSDGLTAVKYIADINIVSQQCKSLLPVDMTAAKLIDVIHKQELIRGLPPAYNNLKTTLRGISSLKLDEIIERIVGESRSLEDNNKMASIPVHKVTDSNGKLIVPCAVPGCPTPHTHATEKCWITHPELKRHRKPFNKGPKANEVKHLEDQLKHAWLVRNTVNNVLSSANAPIESDLTGKVVRTFNMDSGCSTTIVKDSVGVSNINTSSSKAFALADQSIVKSSGTGVLTGGGKNLSVDIVPKTVRSKRILDFQQS